MDISTFLKSIIDPTQVWVLVSLLSANFVLGVLAAVKLQEVTLADFKNIWIRIASVAGAYLAVSVVAVTLIDFSPMRSVIWATLVAFLTAQIVSNLKDLGLPVPDGIAKVLEKPKVKG